MTDQFNHHSDPLPKGMPDYGRELYKRFLAASDGMPADAMISASVNMLAHTIRECYGLRSQAEERIDVLFAKCKEITFQFYDPVTNKRRSTVPFTQRVQPPTLVVASRLHNVKGNGDV
jgi:hypothetical protein